MDISTKEKIKKRKKVCPEFALLGWGGQILCPKIGTCHLGGIPKLNKKNLTKKILKKHVLNFHFLPKDCKF
jgi:hypothetical protein